MKFDLLDLHSADLLRELGKFEDTIKDLDRRIGTVLIQSFDDCSGLHACFRLLESFQGLLFRPTIQQDFEKKYYEILKLFSRDLDDANIVFQQFKVSPPIHYNMAPVTGSIAWIHELKERIGKYMEKLKGVYICELNV
jgi:dynein heavy chain